MLTNLWPVFWGRPGVLHACRDTGSGFRARGTGTGLARQTPNRLKTRGGADSRDGTAATAATPVRPREVASYSQSTGRALCVSRLFPVFLNVPPDLVRPTRYRYRYAMRPEVTKRV